MSAARLRERPLAFARACVVTAAGAWLLASGALKVQDVEQFERVLASHGLLPEAWLSPVARATPMLEMLAGVAIIVLVVSVRERAAGLVGSLAFVALAIYAAGMVLSPPPKPVSCGCGVFARDIANWKLLALQNSGVALLLAVLAMAAGSQPLRPAESSRTHRAA